jgi:4,5-DOPA dioxygenase extradiol
MNALEDNKYTQRLNQIGREYPRPKAILCISAHWLTEGSWVTAMPQPKTIHDFYGFPKELFDVQYPAAGSPDLAETIASQVTYHPIQKDQEMWGLDHGTWSVMRHLYPKADIPVLQLSINFHQPPQYHFDLGKSLRFLRDQNILILGSGNIVHNLRQINWDKFAPSPAWAEEFDQFVKAKVSTKDFLPFLGEVKNLPGGALSVPTNDHWYPLLYILGASDEHDSVTYLYEGMENSTISMRSISFE